MHLYINTTSPFVRLVRLSIYEKGLSDRVDLEIVDPWADPDAFLKANPAGRVPVLTTDDGHVFAEAQLILRYLDEIAQPLVSTLWSKPSDFQSDPLQRERIAL